MTFQLDTSGAVGPYGGDGEYRLPGFTLANGVRTSHVSWSDLDPFTQGYVEALKQQHRSLKEIRPASGGDGACWLDWRFSDLAPETLARIMEDCAQFKAGAGYYTADDARNFWRRRQAGLEQKHGFPPLTVALNDDGKVVFA